jgi:hypothetical protein
VNRHGRHATGQPALRLGHPPIAEAAGETEATPRTALYGTFSVEKHVFRNKQNGTPIADGLSIDFPILEFAMTRTNNIQQRPGKIDGKTFIIYGVMGLLGVPGLIMIVLFLFGIGH